MFFNFLKEKMKKRWVKLRDWKRHVLVLYRITNCIMLSALVECLQSMLSQILNTCTKKLYVSYNYNHSLKKHQRILASYLYI